MTRTRFRADQERDADFLSEAELNEFLAKVVITGTVGDDDTELLETVDDYLPGRGLFTGTGGVTVITGTQNVTISGFRTEFVIEPIEDGKILRLPIKEKIKIHREFHPPDTD